MDAAITGYSNKAVLNSNAPIGHMTLVEAADFIGPCMKLVRTLNSYVYHYVQVSLTLSSVTASCT